MEPSEPDSMSLDRSGWAERFGLVVAENLSREYPYAAHHTTTGADDRPLPVQIHPAFGTSYDWHSSVHMHWLAVRLLGFGVSPQVRARLMGLLQAHLTPANLAAEGAYLAAQPHYERPYGWGWAMTLAAEVTTSEVPRVARMAAAFDPLVEAIAANAVAWLARAAYPVRHGVHSNSAFALTLILQGARILERTELEAACEQVARRWFGEDRGWPFGWERSGHDFLSPGLAEADLMREVTEPAEFPEWAGSFFSELRPGSDVLAPAQVLDDRDGQQVHLFGLDLSRAGAARRVASALVGTTADDVSRLLAAAADGLLAAGLSASVGEEYYSTHWLASFAWDAMEAREGAARP